LANAGLLGVLGRGGVDEGVDLVLQAQPGRGEALELGRAHGGVGGGVGRRGVGVGSTRHLLERLAGRLEGEGGVDDAREDDVLGVLVALLAQDGGGAEAVGRHGQGAQEKGAVELVWLGFGGRAGSGVAFFAAAIASERRRGQALAARQGRAQGHLGRGRARAAAALGVAAHAVGANGRGRLGERGGRAQLGAVDEAQQARLVDAEAAHGLLDDVGRQVARAQVDARKDGVFRAVAADGAALGGGGAALGGFGGGDGRGVVGERLLVLLFDSLLAVGAVALAQLAALLVAGVAAGDGGGRLARGRVGAVLLFCRGGVARGVLVAVAVVVVRLGLLLVDLHLFLFVAAQRRRVALLALAAPLAPGRALARRARGRVDLALELGDRGRRPAAGSGVGAGVGTPTASDRLAAQPEAAHAVGDHGLCRGKHAEKAGVPLLLHGRVVRAAVGAARLGHAREELGDRVAQRLMHVRGAGAGGGGGGSLRLLALGAAALLLLARGGDGGRGGVLGGGLGGRGGLGLA
jgi:hypothetical protein